MIKILSKKARHFFFKKIQRISPSLQSYTHKTTVKMSIATEESPIFFWKRTDEYGIFSQWAATDFTIEGITFSSAEQYMMYKKACLFGDQIIAEEILKENDPVKIKDLGRRVKNFDRELWEKNANQIVFLGNLAKFEQNQQARAKLLETGNRSLVEASPYDKIWGIGYTEKDALENKDNWGSNLLGVALEKTRRALASK